MTKQSRGTRNERIIGGDGQLFLKRDCRGESYDEQATPELDSEALDFRAASELFAPGHQLKRADLETLRLVTKHQGRTVPTVGGMLLFGKQRERFFPDAWSFASNDQLKASAVQIFKTKGITSFKTV